VSPWIADCARSGSTSRACESWLTASTLPIWVMVKRRTVGTKTKKIDPRISIGTQ
jgi:hypothetical protein